MIYFIKSSQFCMAQNTICLKGLYNHSTPSVFFQPQHWKPVRTDQHILTKLQPPVCVLQPDTTTIFCVSIDTFSVIENCAGVELLYDYPV